MPPGSSCSGIAASPTTGEKAREIAMGRNQRDTLHPGAARPPRLWQASSATEPAASVHHRDCRDRRLRSRRTSPALTCRDRLRAVGPSVTGWRRLELGELCGICVARSGIAAETGNGKCRFAGAFRDGSDGTRTRRRVVVTGNGRELCASRRAKLRGRDLHGGERRGHASRHQAGFGVVAVDAHFAASISASRTQLSSGCSEAPASLR
jgi:hypothetical protein